jgi:amino acid adenylation domain-containing protein
VIALSELMSRPEPVSELTTFPRSDVEQSIVRRFERQVELHGRRTAVVDKQRELTYDELNRRANTLAHALARVTGPEPTRVAIYLDKGGAYLAAILAVLKAGHAYVPLDPAFPRDRNAFLVEDARAPVLLTNGAHARGLADLLGAATTVVDIDQLAPLVADERNLDLSISPDALAYIIYTSGSTGRPKGVMQNHRNTLHGCMRRTHLQQIVPEDRMTLFYSCSVMGSVYCIFGALLNGAALLPFDFREEGLLDLAAWLVKQRVSVFHSVASVFRQFANAFDGQIAGSSVRLVIFGGERVFVSDIAAARRVFAPRVSFFTGLGSTETGTIRHFLIGPETELASRVVPIGYPVEGVDVVLTAASGEPVDTGEVGEINVRSRYLALGYWNNEEATQRAFSVVDADAGIRNYRMGDLAQLLPGGLLEHRGRKDFQVKIRGFRVEVGEVDAALQSHPALREGAVKAQDIGNETQLVAYVVPRSEAPGARPLSARELREFLRAKLPSYMVPSVFVGLAALPRTPNGKVDAIALPLPLPTNELSDGRRATPATASERALVGICSALLGRAEIGTNESFLDVGGDSLSATKLVARIHKQLGVKLSMRSVLSGRDIAALATEIDQSPSAPSESSFGLEVTTRERVPATSAQKRMWLVEQLHPGTAAYNISNSVRLRGPLEVDALTQALNGVVARHGSLRTGFEAEEEVLWQVERPHTAFTLPCTDLTSVDAATREELALGLMREHSGRSLDLARGPLFVCQLLLLGAEDHVLCLAFNHIVYDNIWSSSIFFQELGALYQGLARGPSVAPSLEPVQFRFLDYAAWEQARVERGELGEHLAYWTKQLEGLPPSLELPSDRPRPAETSFRGGQVAFKVPPELRLALLSFNRRHSTTVFMSLLAAWQLLLHRYSAQDDLAVGTPTGRRYRPETEGMIGLFINNLVLRARFPEGISFEELARQVRQTCIEAFEHDEVPFESLVAALSPTRTAGAPPFFRHFFIHRNASQSSWALPGLELEPLVQHHGTSKFDLTLSILETEHELSGTLEYSSDLFERESMQRLTENYLTLLGAALAAPAMAVARLEIVSEAERELAVRAWNRTSHEYPAELGLTGLFKLQVVARPEAVAVVADDATLCYADLDEAAERMAAQLRALGVGRDVLVGVCLQRSARLLVALLGVLKAGGAYVPLDPEYPAERLSSMLEDSGARVLLCETGVVDRFTEPSASVLLFDQLPEFATMVRTKREHVTPAPEDLAYVIYTSGSTGKPKGVQVTQRGLANFLCSMQREPGITSADVVQSLTTVCFDIAVLELFLPLIAGARVIISDREVSLSPTALQKTLLDHGATLMQATPVTWRMLLDGGWQGQPKLKVLCGGEAMGDDLAERLLGTGCEIWNVYGPTETTVWSSIGRIGAKSDARCLGQPIANTQLLVTNASLALQPIGVPGELMIGGDGLARGYLGRDDLTAERFVESALGSNGRLYRTGDLAVRRADGAIEFFGRADHQVKIRGFRVELGDVEAQLARHPAVRQAVVVAREDVPGEKRLVAYCVPTHADPSEPRSVPADVLHAHLKALLPHYMIPAVFVTLEALPLTPNGKIDRKRLPAPADPEKQQLEPLGGGGVRDDLDRSFLAVWEAVLRRSNLSIDDDFFALGGDSMLAIRLVKELKRATGIDYPLSTLFSAPTIRELVARVGEAAERAASVVHLNSVHSGIPIYCLAGVKLYKELAEHFVSAPVFGVFAKRELAGIQAQVAGETVTVPVAALTQIYADAIARHATQKKLVLVGLSFGGLMALEVAAELNGRGFDIRHVALFDSVPPGAYVRSFRKTVTDLTQQLAEGRAVDTLKDLFGRAYARVVASVPLDLTRLPLGSASRRQSVQGQAFRKMTAAYDPSGKEYFLDALLIKATQKTLGIGARLKPDYGFREMILGRLDVAEVDADHRGLLDGAAASRVYTLLSDYLEANDPLSSGVVSISPPAQPGQARMDQAADDGQVGPSPRQRSGS